MCMAAPPNTGGQEVAGPGHTEWGQNMPADFVYTVAGNPNGTGGDSGNGGPGNSALMTAPGAIWLDGTGNPYVSHPGKNQGPEATQPPPTIPPPPPNPHPPHTPRPVRPPPP